MTSLRERLHRDLTITRFSWAVQDHPQSRHLTRELRRELDTTAAEIGMARAVADLGSPRALADAHLAELDTPAPRWTAGAVWGGIVLAFVLYTQLAYAFGTLDALAGLAGTDTLTAHREVLGARITFEAGPDGLMSTLRPSWGWLLLHVLAFAVPFLLGARAWRVRPARRRPRVRPATGDARA
jgi:hypothetical protein